MSRSICLTFCRVSLELSATCLWNAKFAAGKTVTAHDKFYPCVMAYHAQRIVWWNINRYFEITQYFMVWIGWKYIIASDGQPQIIIVSCGNKFWSNSEIEFIKLTPYLAFTASHQRKNVDDVNSQTSIHGYRALSLCIMIAIPIILHSHI